MESIRVDKLNEYLKEALQYKIDHKTKPVGSLGYLEELAVQIGMIQSTLVPELKNPVMLTIASDHNICEERVSPCPVEITWQQVLNFLEGGGGIGLFCEVYGMQLKVVDAGVNHDFPDHPNLIKSKVRKGSRNFLNEPAMTMDECNESINNGRKIVADINVNGSNLVGFGEMGIGNTSPASALMSIICDIPIEICVGAGSGLDKNGIKHKTNILRSAILKHGISDNPIENLSRFGGLEIACIAGGMLEAASRKMIILVDGFITTSAALVAYSINPNVRAFMFFAHKSDEGGHSLMLDYLKARPILNLGLRLGEGTGAAMAYSILQGAVAMLNRMTSFDEAKVHDTTHIRID
ncbi:MAG: nicotinate-nucleotide--dimethylbenzimidazole phosphoribosyltransferase [Bacteroidales bacterium]|nr:nicotinate-nucleotide--dimethylbenzimidazole phosphoribosyltransferase [Bacteroidales bacterium]